MPIKDRIHEAENAAALTIIVSMCLSILKATVGILSGAIVLITDAVDSAGDVVTAFAAYVGLRFARKKADEEFQYGYYKAENLASLFISAVLIVSALVFIWRGYERMFTTPEIGYHVLTVSVALISGATAFAMHRFLLRTSQRTGSDSLRGTAADRLKDVFSSLLVLVGIIFAEFKLPYGEGIVTILLSLFILRIGYKLLKESVLSLMDVSPDKSIEASVRKILDESDRVMSYHKLKLRKSGPCVLGQVDIRVRKETDVFRAHQAAERLKEHIMRQMPRLTSFMIHIEPHESDRRKLIVPLIENNGLQSRVCEDFDKASYVLLAELDDHETQGVRVLKRDALSEALLEKVDAVALAHVSDHAFYKLRDHKIDVYSMSGAKAGAVVAMFLQGKLVLRKEP
jgi:cation diffusion facilitator family transporter